MCFSGWVFPGGDTVALFSGSTPEWVYFWLGAARIGAVSAAVNAANKGDYLRHALALSSAKVVVTDTGERCRRVLDVADELDALRTVLTDEPAGSRGADVDFTTELLGSASTETPPDALGFTPYDIGRAVLHLRNDGTVEGRRDQLALPVHRRSDGRRRRGSSPRAR